MMKVDLTTRLVLQFPQSVFTTMYVQQVSLQGVDDDFVESGWAREEQDRPHMASQAREGMAKVHIIIIPQACILSL